MVRVVSIGRPVADLLADPKVGLVERCSCRMRRGWNILWSFVEEHI